MPVTNEQLVAWLDACADVFAKNREFLTDLDAAIGDADHGINMDRGFSKVKEKLPAIADKEPGALLKDVGMTLLSSVGGASGPLYGTFFMKAGMAVAGKAELEPEDMVALLEAGVEGVVGRGRPVLEDKTMYDAWFPALEAFKIAVAEGKAVQDALEIAVEKAKAGVEATIPMQARKGRASYLGERSIGHQDPGATSTWLLLKTLHGVLVG